MPEANLLGERGRGFAHFIQTLDEGRVAFAALCTGAAQGCLEEAMRYAKSRNVFGHPIGDNQHIAFTIARMEARVHSARLAWLDAAHRLVAGQPFKLEASLAKLIGSEAAMDNARDATQIFGGYGVMNENPVARHYRDSKILEIGEGTTEVQLMVIARELGFSGARSMTRDVEQRGLYYEELELDVRYVHRPGRTMTEADNVLFSTLTMNPQALHLDAAWSAGQPFGQRLVNSMMTLAVLVGSSVAQLTQGTIVANLGFTDVRFPHPLFHGDTLYSSTVVTDKRLSSSRPGQGVVTLEHTGRNQDDVVVAIATRTVLFWCTP